MTGRAVLGSKKFRREVTFQCSEVILSSPAGASEGTKKVMVQWDVKPERFMKDLDKFQGVRHIETDTSTRPRKVRSVSRSSSRPDRSPSASNWAGGTFESPSFFDLDAAAVGASFSESDFEDVPEIVDIDEAACAAAPEPECAIPSFSSLFLIVFGLKLV